MGRSWSWRTRRRPTARAFPLPTPRALVRHDWVLCGRELPLTTFWAGLRGRCVMNEVSQPELHPGYRKENSHVVRVRPRPAPRVSAPALGGAAAPVSPSTVAVPSSQSVHFIGLTWLVRTGGCGLLPEPSGGSRAAALARRFQAAVLMNGIVRHPSKRRFL